MTLTAPFPIQLQIMHRLKSELMSILPGSNKPKRHIGPYPVSESTIEQIFYLPNEL